MRSGKRVEMFGWELHSGDMRELEVAECARVKKANIVGQIYEAIMRRKNDDLGSSAKNTQKVA